MKFTFASLNEYAEGKKNFKKYICEYYRNMCEQKKDDKDGYRYLVIAEKFGICTKTVERIVKVWGSEVTNNP
jgi:hypothetical protein